jgi:hypothetical protein
MPGFSAERRRGRGGGSLAGLSSRSHAVAGALAAPSGAVREQGLGPRPRRRPGGEPCRAASTFERTPRSVQSVFLGRPGRPSTASTSTASAG